MNSNLGVEGKVSYEVIKKEMEKGIALIISIFFAYMAWMLITSLW